MSASVLEILELANGEIVLQESEKDNSPLVSIKFSDKAREYLDDALLEVAQAMIKSGIEAAAEIAEEKGLVKAEMIETIEHTIH